jgi:hypothetical protein
MGEEFDNFLQVAVLISFIVHSNQSFLDSFNLEPFVRFLPNFEITDFHITWMLVDLIQESFLEYKVLSELLNLLETLLDDRDDRHTHNEHVAHIISASQHLLLNNFVLVRCLQPMVAAKILLPVLELPIVASRRLVFNLKQ